MQKLSPFPLSLAAFLSLLCVGLFSPAHASETDGKGSFYWTGAVDNNFEEPGNWVFGSPTGPVCLVPPKKNDWECSAYFTDATTPATKAVNIPANREIFRFMFQSEGWSFTGGTPTMKEMRATGGEGLIASFAQQVTIKSSNGVSCVAGGELHFDGGINQDTGTISISGGGTVVMKHNNGWSNERKYSISQDTLVRVDYTSPFGSNPGQSVSLNSENAKLQYKSTVADAEAKFGHSERSSNGLINGFDTDNFSLEAVDIGDGYVEIRLRYLGAPKIGEASFAVVNDACVVSVTLDGPEASVYVVATDGVNAPIELLLDPELQDQPLSGLSPNTTYLLSVKASNDVSSVTQDLGIYYTGVPTLALGADAFEEGLVPGIVTISRASASIYPLEIAYTCTGSGAGQSFIAPSGLVTIPAGETSADIALVPLSDSSVSDDLPLSFALAAGSYNLAGALPVTLTVRNASEYPADKNVWIATPESDGLASTAANWSRGRVPNATDDILVDGLYSNESMTWDAGVNGLSDTVASWIQRNYTGTNTVLTAYTGAFQTLSIVGDCSLSSGVWTHLANDSAQTYRLNVSVGGDFSLDTDATLSAYRKGYAAGKYPSGGAFAIHAGGRDSLTCVNGSVTQPENIGAGGVPWNKNLPGGGAIKLVVAGDAVVNGKIDVSAGQNTSTWTECTCGAPGSIFLQAASVSGSGTLDAAAPLYNASANTPSGGRIGIVLTEAEELALPVANLKATGALGRERSSSGAGTIFVKTANEPYGTLYIRNTLREIGGTYGIMIPDRFGTTQIPAGETWTFDRIVFEQAGILSVPEGTTLRLPNGFASITGSSRTAGLLLLGGTIDAGEENPHVLRGSWVFHADVPYTFDRDTVVTNGAAIGLLRLYNHINNLHQCTVTVQGDLTVAHDAYLYAVESGFCDPYQGRNLSWLGGPFSHGGTPGILGLTPSAVYGSVLHPVLPGTMGHFNDTAAQSPGGGALILTACGNLALEGQALSIGGPGTRSYQSGGAGGSINITASTLSGNGSISANGHDCDSNQAKLLDGQAERLQNQGVISPSGGGRIAVRLTAPNATFPAGFAQRVTAYGGVYGNTNSQGGTATNTMCSAGTIYLQDGTQSEGAGTVYIRNGAREYNATPHTPFPSTTYGGEEDNFRAVTLSVSELSRIALTQPTKVDELFVEEGSQINLCGSVLTVTRATLGNARLPQGYYTATDTAVAGYLSDSSENSTGGLLVAGDCTLLLFR